MCFPDFAPSAPPAEPLYPALRGLISRQPPVYVPTYVQAPPGPLLTQAIHQQTENLLSYANQMSYSILNRDTPRPPPYAPSFVQQAPIIKKRSPLFSIGHLDLSNRSWNMFNRVTHQHFDKSQDSKKEERNRRFLVGLIGLVASLGTMFFLGKAVAEEEDIQEDALNFDELKGRWNQNKPYYNYNSQYQFLVDRIVNRVDLLMQRKQANRVHQIALLTFGCMAGGVAFAGAILGSGALMAAAAIIGAVTGIATAYKLGYNYFSKRDQKDAQAIDQAFVEMSQIPQPAILA